MQMASLRRAINIFYITLTPAMKFAPQLQLASNIPATPPARVAPGEANETKKKQNSAKATLRKRQIALIRRPSIHGNSARTPPSEVLKLNRFHSKGSPLSTPHYAHALPVAVYGSDGAKPP